MRKYLAVNSLKHSKFSTNSKLIYIFQIWIINHITLIINNDEGWRRAKIKTNYTWIKKKLKQQERSKEPGSIQLLIPSIFKNIRAEEEEEISDGPVFLGKLESRFIRDTNESYVYGNFHENCYVFAAYSAYINKILRIYGSMPQQSFAECDRFADYNNGDDERPEEAPQRLKKHFKYEILFDVTKSVSIRDILTLSVLISFSTSSQGWISTANGELLIKSNEEPYTNGNAEDCAEIMTVMNSCMTVMQH